MRWYVVRHASAVRHGPFSDADRPLNTRGQQQAEHLGRALVRLGVQPEHAWVSPALRCRQTAEAICGALQLQPEVEESLSVLGDVSQLLERVQRNCDDQSILLVGHQPGLERLAAQLLGAKASAIHLSPAGAACFESAGKPTETDTAVLHWLMTAQHAQDIFNATRRDDTS